MGNEGDEQKSSSGLAQDKEVSSEVKIRNLESKYLALAEGGSPVGIKAVKDYFETVWGRGYVLREPSEDTWQQHAAVTS